TSELFTYWMGGSVLRVGVATATGGGTAAGAAELATTLAAGSPTLPCTGAQEGGGVTDGGLSGIAGGLSETIGGLTARTRSGGISAPGGGGMTGGGPAFSTVGGTDGNEGGGILADTGTTPEEPGVGGNFCGLEATPPVPGTSALTYEMFPARSRNCSRKITG